MYGTSLVILYSSIAFTIPMARQFVNGHSTIVDDRFSKRIKLGKFNPFFVGYYTEYKKKKEIYDIEFVIQLIAYICTFINIILGILSPAFYAKHSNEIWAWLDIIFGLLSIFLLILISMTYSFITEIIIPYIFEIPNWEKEKTEKRIELLKKQLKESIELKDKNKTLELMNKRNCRMLRRYKNSYGRDYMNKKTRKYKFYGDLFLFHFSSYVLYYRKKIIKELNKPSIDTDWKMIHFVLFEQDSKKGQKNK